MDDVVPEVQGKTFSKQSVKITDPILTETPCLECQNIDLLSQTAMGYSRDTNARWIFYEQRLAKPASSLGHDYVFTST